MFKYFLKVCSFINFIIAPGNLTATVCKSPVTTIIRNYLYEDLVLIILTSTDTEKDRIPAEKNLKNTICLEFFIG